MNSLAQITARTQTDALGRGVRWLEIDNPGRRNALTERMWDDLRSQVRAASINKCVHVVVLTGASHAGSVAPAFSAGADISEFETLEPQAQADAHRDFANSAFGALLACPKPTVAIIDGICFGGGLELAVCCDLRIASDRSRFSIPAAKIGVGYNARWIKPLVNVVGPAKAKEILMTGRIYDGGAAERMGLLVELVSPEMLAERAAGLIEDLLRNAPKTMAAAKACVDALSHPAEPVDMGALDRAVTDCFLSDDYREGRRAFLEKRRPQFKGE